MRTVLEAYNAALLAVASEMAPQEVAVGAMRPMDPSEGLPDGVAPAMLCWSHEDGNAMWAGVMAAFKALGVDPAKPIESHARFSL